MMAKYTVFVPIVGHMSVSVEADSVEEAIESAIKVDWCEQIKTPDDVYIENLEAVRHVVEGNVFYGSFSQAEAELE